MLKHKNKFNSELPQWILEKFLYDIKNDHLSNCLCNNSTDDFKYRNFLTDLVYVPFYIKDPIYYMIFALYDKNCYDDKFFNKNFKDNWDTKLINYDSISFNNINYDDYKDSDLVLVDDCRFRYEKLTEYMQLFHPSKCEKFDYSLATQIYEPNEINQKIIKIYIDNMLNHRKMILKFLSRISSKKVDKNDIYNNLFIYNLNEKDDFDLLDCEQVVKDFLQRLNNIYQKYLNLIYDIISTYIIKEMNIKDVQSIEYYSCVSNDKILEGDSDDYNIFWNKDVKHVFKSALNILWTNYYYWVPYSNVYSTFIYSRHHFTNIFSILNKRIQFININAQNNILLVKQRPLNSSEQLSMKILNHNDKINIYDIFRIIDFSNRNDIKDFVRNEMKFNVDIYDDIGEIIKEVAAKFNNRIWCELIGSYKIAQIQCDRLFESPPIEGKICISNLKIPFKLHIDGYIEFYITIGHIKDLESFVDTLSKRVENYTTSKYQKYLAQINNSQLINIDNDVQNIISQILYYHPNIDKYYPNLKNNRLIKKVNKFKVDSISKYIFINDDKDRKEKIEKRLSSMNWDNVMSDSI